MPADRDFFTDLRAIRDCSAPSETKHLLLVLMTFCRQDQCWPSMETIAGCLGIGIRATQVRIQAAMEQGWMLVEEGRGRGNVNRYTLNTDRAVNEQASQEKVQPTAHAQPIAPPEKAQPAAQKVQPTAQKVQPAAPRTTNELPKEQPQARAREKRTHPKTDFPGFDAFWDAWPKHHRKEDRAKCLGKWREFGLENRTDEVIAGLDRWKRSQEWARESGRFIPAPHPWLNRRRWETAKDLKLVDDDAPWTGGGEGSGGDIVWRDPTDEEMRRSGDARLRELGLDPKTATKQEIDRAMRAAGWLGEEQEITPEMRRVTC